MNCTNSSTPQSPRRVSFPGILLTLLWLGGFRAWADQTLIPTGSVWKYLDTGANPGAAWTAAGFNDSAWKWGPAQLGYGDGDEATVLGFGTNASAKYITTYFRKSFPVATPSSFSGLALRVLRDDGVVVYLNGAEIYRNNMPAGSVTSTTLASSGISGLEESTAFLSASIGAGGLIAGDNLLAVEIHQNSGASSDISFDLELVGLVPARPSVTRGPYLQKSTPESMTLRWRTSLPTDTRVQFGTNTSLGTSVALPDSTTEHSVTLTGLTPNTLYYYAVGDSVGTLASGTDFLFYTAPPAGTVQPLRFWVLGDAGTGSSGQLSVRNAFYQQSANRYTDLILLLGDNAYNNGTDAEYQAKLFDVYGSIFRSTASFSVIGNHDTAQLADPVPSTTPYFQIFNPPMAGEGGGVPSGTPRYYSFDYGNIHFVCLDSMTSDRTTTSPMLTWLRQDLEQNSADWLIALFHHPPYSKGSHDSDNPLADGGRMAEMRANALPILEANGVDLVLSGHSHSYERSLLLDQHYGVSTTLTSAMVLDPGSGREAESGAYSKDGGGPASHQGAVYVVTGSAGQIAGGTLNHPAMFISLNQFGSFILEVNGPRLDAQFLTSTGTTNDSFTLIKGPPANLSPSVVLSAPQNDASVIEGTALSLSAATLDSDGSVVSVDFQVDGTLLETDPTSPFTVLWTATGVGTHLLTAVATDNAGAQTLSTPVSVTVTPRPPPVAPSGLQISSVSANQVTLVWTDNATNESGFRLERSPNGTDWTGIATVGPNSTGYSDVTGLSPGATYGYRVLAYNVDGDSANSEPVFVTLPAPLPSTPASLAARAYASNSIYLSWIDTATNETGFLVERSTNAINWALIRTLGANTTNYFNSAGVVAGIPYFYRIRAYNGSGYSAYSSVVSATIPTAPPSAPINLTAASTRVATVDLNWTDTASNEDGFKVERSSNGVDWTQINTTGANATTYSNSYGVLSGVPVRYRVRAYNAQGNSTYSNTVIITPR
ncbi:MAG: metallophosphoesterase [Verrucomicrobiales bacterium]|nr:metallophosphoesterase [Verrucomicrobiales bacterium]